MKATQIVVTSIKWDAPKSAKLPKRVVIDINEHNTDLLENIDEYADVLCDYLSDEYGYCIESFCPEVKETETNNNIDVSEKQYDFTKNSDIKLYIYNEVYKKAWYQSHSITEEDIEAKKTEYQQDCLNDEFDGTFEDYELEYGYHRGEVYVCFDEFLDNEIEDYKDLIKKLKQPQKPRRPSLDATVTRAKQQKESFVHQQLGKSKNEHGDR